MRNINSLLISDAEYLNNRVSI